MYSQLNSAKKSSDFNVDSTINLKHQQESQSPNLDNALKLLAIGNFEERWAISKVLVKLGSVVISPLKTIILDEQANLEHRWFSLRILSQLKNPEIILVATELLVTTKEEDLISLATQTLAIQGKESIVFLSQLLTEEDYRYLACKALTQIPNREVILPLLSVVEDENLEVRQLALSALRNFNHPKIMPVLIKALQDYHSEIRKEALIGLGLKLKTNQEIPLVSIISPLLNDINIEVAQQAALALSRASHPFAVSALERVLLCSTTPYPLQETIVKVLGWIAIPESIECLGRFICQDNLLLAGEIIKILGRISQPELKPIVITILSNFYHHKSANLSQPQILQSLCYSFTQLQSLEALPILEEIEGSSLNQQVIFHAQSAIKLITENH